MSFSIPSQIRVTEFNPEVALANLEARTNSNSFTRSRENNLFALDLFALDAPGYIAPITAQEAELQNIAFEKLALLDADGNNPDPFNQAKTLL